jgi:hypothetical protein
MEVLTVVKAFSRADRLRKAVFTGAVLTIGLLLLDGGPAIAALAGHFSVSYGFALYIVYLVVEGAWWVAIWFPWIIPVEVTVQVLVAVFGIAFAAGW